MNFAVVAATAVLLIAVCHAQKPDVALTVFTPEYIKNNVDYGLVKPSNCDADNSEAMIVPTYAEAANPSSAAGAKLELTNSINYTQIMNDGDPNNVKLPSDISPWFDNGGEVFKAPAFYLKCWDRTAGAVPENCTTDCITHYNLWGNGFRSFGELTCNGFYPPTNETTSSTSPPPGTVSIILTNQCTEYLYQPPAGETEVWTAVITDEFGDEWSLQAGLGANFTSDQQWFDALKKQKLPAGWTMEIRNITEPEEHYSYNMGSDCWVPILKDNLGWSWHSYKYKSGKVYTGVLSKIICPLYKDLVAASMAMAPAPAPSSSSSSSSGSPPPSGASKTAARIVSAAVLGVYAAFAAAM